jgi:hypothetical protein
MVQPTYEYSGVCYTATSGQTIFALTSTDGNPIGYLSPDHIHVRTSANSGETWVPLPVNTAWNFADPATSIVLVTPATAGVWVDIQRKTPIDEDWVDFQAGSLLTAGQLNDAETFSLYCDQEIADSVSGLTPSIIGLDTTDDLPEGQINLYYTDTRVAAWIAANLSDTDDLKEGVLNLYYTDARVNAWINTNLSSTDQLAEGSNNLYYTDARAEAVVAAWIAGNLSSTDDLPEGSINLYYTNARVASWINNNLGSTDQLVEGSNNLYYTDARVEAYVNGEGYVKGPVVTKIVAGNNVGISPESGTGIVTINATGGSGQGIPEAPLDGTAYGRQDGHWEPVLMLTGGDLTGDLTLDTDKVVLGVNGNITAAGLGQFGTIGTATGTCGVSVGQTGNTFGSLALYSNTTSQSAIEVFSAPDGSTTKTSVAAINNDGSASFAGDLYSNLGSSFGKFQVTQAGGRGLVVAALYDQNEAKITLNSDGSATFAGDIYVGESAASTTQSGSYIGVSGQVVTNNVGNSPSTDRVFLGKYKNAATSEINADGSATFAGDVQVAGDPNAGVEGSKLRSFQVSACSSPTRYIYTGFTEGSTTPTFTVTADGSASFAGGNTTISKYGWIQTNDTFTSNRTVGSDLVIIGKLNGVATSSIKADGSATFKGDVAIGDSTTTFLDKAAIIAALTEEQRETFAAAITAWNAQPEPYDAEDPTTLPADTPLREAIVRVTTAGKINLNADGSATFAGDLRSFTRVLGGADTSGGRTSGTAGSFYSTTTDVGNPLLYLDNKTAGNGWICQARSGANSENLVYQLKNDGSAIFASRITAAGYSMANLTQL